ncbi:unnamed protein product [Spodoptera littoralis]|uniref:Uncharacterized protein n=1 Tax=Spodoptera littoralis TaxID=7109 RepID=A0A9P0I1S0_SPOLI|nr:unnamed protein product [Spodoptera littoralis]
MRYFCLTILILYISFIHASILSNFRDNILSIFDEERRGVNGGNRHNFKGSESIFQNIRQQNAKDKKSAQDKAKVLQNAKMHEVDMKTARSLLHSKQFEIKDKRVGKEYYQMDPVLNEVRNVFRARPARRQSSKRRIKNYDETSSSSSSDEMLFWKQDFNEFMMEKKFEALNATLPRGDVVNMVAARPWGVPCGDPDQHDIPWGSCMLPGECESEYRIYRGDYLCGRTTFVCCSLQYTNYDMYQGLEATFEGSSFSTDSSEKKNIPPKHKKRQRERKKRKRERNKRKRKIKHNIKKIVQEIKSILHRAYSNGTTMRKKKTKELKKFIENMKKQYKKDRQSLLHVHEFDLTQIDERLQKRLDQVKGVNEKFFSNDTFREILINGTTKEKLKEFLRTHPKLRKILTQRRQDGGLLEPVIEDTSSDNLQYDIEYGFLYY